MINGFEDITYNLTSTELEVYIPLIINGLRTKTSESMAITNRAMCQGIYDFQVSRYKEKRGVNPPKNRYRKIAESRMRMMIRYIRVNDLLRDEEGNPLFIISSSKGYWVTTDPMRIKLYLDSLHHRASANFYLAQKIKENAQKLLN